MTTPNYAGSAPHIVETTEIATTVKSSNADANVETTNPCGANYLYLVIVALVVVVIGLSVGIGTKTNKDSAREPSMAPTASSAPSMTPTVSAAPSISPSLSPTGFEDFLNSTFTWPEYTIQSLLDDLSPESKALDWIFSFFDYRGLPPWRKRQLFALASLYYSLKGERWDNNTHSWLSEDHECRWIHASNNHSISCNEMDRIQSIHLSHLDLVPKALPLPPELEFLTHLQSFGLTQSRFYAPLADIFPTPFYRLNSTLKELTLGGNEFLGTIPTQLGLLTELRVLNLSHNNLILKIPSELGQLTKLDYLDVSNNSLTGPLPSELGLLTSLKVLNVTNNYLSSTNIPFEIRALQTNYSLSVVI